MDSGKGRFRLAAMGDVMLAREVGRHLVEAPADFAMHDIRDLLKDADVICANLENPVAVTGRPDPVQDPHITFRARPQSLDVLRSLGVSVVSLGNNHMLDYGEAALIETLEQLDSARIKWVGAGRNYEEANRPLLLECGGRRVAFLSYTFIYSANTRMADRRRAGVSDHRLRHILPQIRDLAHAGHDVIVMSHWGYEYCFYPLPYQMRLARRMVDAGASLVIGHGPHYPQGIEEYAGADIIYSLGNFIFDEPHKFANRSFVYRTEMEEGGRPRRREIFPVHLHHHVPHLIQARERERLKRLIENLGARYRELDARFWRDISTSYLHDICNRVRRTRSLKYLFVPTPSFYRDVGPAAIARKLKPANVLGFSRSFGVR